MDSNLIGSGLQVLEDWEPPPWSAKFDINDAIGAAGWRRTGRANFACRGPFGCEMVIYDNEHYRRALLHKTAELKRQFPWVDWRVARRSPEVYDSPREAAERAWWDILDGLDRECGGFDPDDWEVVP